MVKIQLDLTEEENKKLGMIKVKYGLNSKAEAISKIIEDLEIKIESEKK